MTNYDKELDDLMDSGLDNFIPVSQDNNSLNKNNMSKNGLSTDQKIDYIYKALKSQKRNKFFKYLVKLSIFSFFVYLAVNPGIKEQATKMFTEKVLPIFQEQIKEIAVPLIKDLTNEVNSQVDFSWKDLQTIDLWNLTDGQKKLLERMLWN